MKKVGLLSLILILLAGAWAGATYLIGGQVEQQYRALLGELADRGPVTATVEKYERGFASAQVRTVVEFPIAVDPEAQEDGAVTEVPIETLRLVFEETLQHGPLIDGRLCAATVESKLVSVSPGDETFAELLKKHPALKEPLSFSRIHFDGSLANSIDIPQLAWTQDGDEFAWGGLVIDSTYSPSDKSIAGHFAMPRFVVSATDGEMTWNGLSGDFDLVEALPMVYVGRTKGSFGTLHMDLPDEETGERVTLELKGLEVASDSALRDGLIDAKQILRLEGVRVDEETFGPGQVEIELLNMDGAAMSELQTRVFDLIGTAPAGDPEIQLDQLLSLYSSMAGQLLAKGPEFNIRKFAFTTPDGEIDAKLSLKYDGAQGIDFENPALMLQAVNASLDFFVAERLAASMLAGNVEATLKEARERGEIPMSFTDEVIADMAEREAKGKIETVLAQNLFVRKGELIRSKATFNRGELLVNGQVMPFLQ